jgi:serine/threonine-protein kinase
LIFLVGVGYFLWVSFFSSLFTAAPEYTVPSLVGKTMAEINMDPEIDKDVFTITEGETLYSDKYDAGVVMAQDPEADKKLKGDDLNITVTISGGKEYVGMIDVSNLSYRDALIKLQALGLVVPTPEYQTSDKVTKGYVISFTPPVGTQLAPGEKVNLVVSSGPETKSVTVPSFVDETLESAQALLKSLNLIEGSSVKMESDKPVGTVIYQSVPAGTEVNEGSTISFQVSKGPDATSSDPGTSPEVTPSTEPVVYTKKVTVTLPTDRESVQVRIEVDGKVQFNNVVSQAMGTIYPAVTGTGIHQISIYFDGVLDKSYPLDFTKP